jgi:flagellar motor switch protein FliN/FliY
MAEEEKKDQVPESKEDLVQQEDTEEEVVTEPESYLETELDNIAETQDEVQPVDATNENNMELLFDLELPISVELARKEMLIRNILHLGEGSIVEFDKMAGENVDLLVNNKKIAAGEVVVIDDRFGVRITNLINPSERIKGITN